MIVVCPLSTLTAPPAPATETEPASLLSNLQFLAVKLPLEYTAAPSNLVELSFPPPVRVRPSRVRFPEVSILNIL